MTGRQKIADLVRKLRDDAERRLSMADEWVSKAASELECAQALEEVTATLTDERCDELTHDMEDTVSAAN